MATKLRTADSLTQVADTIGSFLASTAPSSRSLTDTVIKPLSDIGEVIVIGGLVRDLAFYGPEERPVSDIDLVVRGSPSMLAAFAEKRGAVPNKFGGFSLITSAFKADFWALSSTWARREGHVVMRGPKDLIRATFFDWDAIVYSTLTGDITAIDGYIDKLHRRVLDLNLEPNPSVRGNLVRALRRIMMWDVRLGPRLKGFVQGSIHSHRWDDLVAAEHGAFHTSYLAQFSSTGEFVSKVLFDPFFSGVGRDDGREVRFAYFKTLPYQYPIPSLPDRIGLSQGLPVKRVRNRSVTPDLFDGD